MEIKGKNKTDQANSLDAYAHIYHKFHLISYKLNKIYLGPK